MANPVVTGTANVKTRIKGKRQFTALNLSTLESPGIRLSNKPAWAQTDTTSNAGSDLVLSNNFKGRPARQNYAIQTAFSMPNELTCTVCNVSKTLSAYSQNQQKRYRMARGDHHIECLSCNCPKKFELTCCVCDRTMAITQFAKSQRRDPGSAECHKCVEKRINEDVDGSDFSDQDALFIPEDDDSGCGNEFGGVAGRLEQLAINGHGLDSHTMAKQHDEDDNSDAESIVSIESSNSSGSSRFSV